MGIFIFLLLYMDLIRASAGKLKVLMVMISNLKQMGKIFDLFCSKFRIEVTWNVKTELTGHARLNCDKLVTRVSRSDLLCHKLKITEFWLTSDVFNLQTRFSSIWNRIWFNSRDGLSQRSLVRRCKIRRSDYSGSGCHQLR